MSHYFSEAQDSEFNPIQIKEIINNKEYTLFTAKGIFSKDKIDFGTKVLCKYMIIKDNDKVLDLGTGIGIIGLIAAAKTRDLVTLIDINKRAIQLARLNTKNKRNIRILQGNSFEPIKDERFNVILLNPPQTAGKKLCFEMIKQSKEHLLVNGSLQLVARHNKGGKTLSKYMKEIFGNLETLARKGGYHVYISTV